MAETRFNTRRVRFSYPHLFQKDQNGKYSLQVLIPKDDDNTVTKMKEACKQIYQDNKGGIFKGLNFDEVAMPYHDGDGRKPKGGAYGPECKGNYVVNAKTSMRVPVVGPDNTPVMDEAMVYPGVYGRVNIAFSAYNNNGNRGINCYLNGVKTYGNGERIGNAFNPDEFNDDYDDSEFEDDDLL